VQAKVAGFADPEADGHVGMLFVHPDFQRFIDVRRVALCMHGGQLKRIVGNGRLLWSRVPESYNILAAPRIHQ
jgi:hypothetical protein